MSATVPGRWPLTVLFAVDGMVFASWASRLPEVQAAVGAGNAGLGVALVGTALGAFLAMPLTGWWCRRRAPAPVALLACLAFCALVLLPGLAGSPATLFAVLVCFGAAYGAVDVSMNSAAVQVAEDRDRPLLPGFHAAFSAGNVLGALLGAALAGLAVPVAAHLTGVGVLGVLALAGSARGLWRGGAAEPMPPSRRAAGSRWPLVLAAAGLTFATAFGEGAVANWSGIRLREAAEASAGIAPLGYALFALAQVAGRVAGTAVTERFGARRVSLTGAALAAAGLLAALAPVGWLAIGGYLLAGLGLSCLFPLGIARAGALAGSSGVAVASTVGYGGFLLGPPLIGVLAGASSLGAALLVPVLLAVVALALAFTLPRGSWTTS